MMPGRDLSSAEKQLEFIRQKIATYPMYMRSGGRVTGRQLWRLKRRSGQQIKVTVSIGLAQRSKQLKRSDSVLKVADQALYKAKRSGRNRLCVHT
ncbi:hypothetical protein GL2_23850 [Microbulbifer sp. GL-2]|nr:hypothetical protein GL2_23850 [Microbulbifer sp. GL-2]